MEKSEIRKKYIEIRKNISNKDFKSKIIFEKLIEQEEYKNSKVIALYKSLDSEVNTNKLIEYSVNLEKIVVLPRVCNENLKFYKNSLNEKFEKSKFGVEEPEGNQEKMINKNEIDLVIVPGVCFDKEKNRLGFGKGYYDRFLEDYNRDVISICFDEQILEDELLPVTKNDIKMHKIITEKRII